MSQDDRFSHLPPVTQQPGFRFYCGAPLITPQGHALGTLVVMDFEPHEPSFEHVETVRRLGRQVMAQLELRRTSAELRQSTEALQRSKLAAEAANRRAEDLLRNIVPEHVASELSDTERYEARYHESVTIGVLDFPELVPRAGAIEPARLVDALHELFCAFDEVVRKAGLEKLKTSGASYVFVGGLAGGSRHPLYACLAALELREVARKINREREKLRLPSWPVRIGVYTGPAMSGIVGSWKFSFDVWGEAPVRAALMNETSDADRIKISSTTQKRVKGLFDCAATEGLEIRDCGRLETFFLEGVADELAAPGDPSRPGPAFHARASSLFFDYPSG